MKEFTPSSPIQKRRESESYKERSYRSPSSTSKSALDGSPSYVHELAEEERLLQQHLNSIKIHGSRMNSSLEESKFMDGLKHCSSMLNELRTNALHPKNYYALYSQATHYLKLLKDYILEEHEQGKSINDLYELVQYAGNVVSRLYLMIVVGTAFIQAKLISFDEMASDLSEMLLGIQNPLKGILARYYFIQGIRNEISNGDTDSMIQFLLSNFGEMNRLWIRMYYQALQMNDQETESERRDLKTLIGFSLLVITETLDLSQDTYSKKVLPYVFEHILACKNSFAQQYLIEYLIEIFPDEFHFENLNVLLSFFNGLEKEVEVEHILRMLMKRFATRCLEKETFDEKDSSILNSLLHRCKELLEEPSVTKFMKRLEITDALVAMLLSMKPTDMQMIDGILGSSCKYLSRLETIKIQNGLIILECLKKIMTFQSDPINLISMEHFRGLSEFLDWKDKRQFSLLFCQQIIRMGVFVHLPGHLSLALGSMSPLMLGIASDESEAGTAQAEELAYDQDILLRSLWFFSSDQCEEEFEILNILAKAFAQGTCRMQFTLPYLFSRTIKLATTYNRHEQKDQKFLQRIFQLIQHTLNAMNRLGYDEQSLSCYTFAASIADSLDMESMAYELLSRSLEIYEERVLNTKAQKNALTIIIAHLQKMFSFDMDNFNVLGSKCLQLSGGVLKRDNQCYLLLLSTHLFWSVDCPSSQVMYRKSGSKLAECFQKAVKIVDGCIDSSTRACLFSDILNVYIYFFERNAEFTSISFINNILELLEMELHTKGDLNDHAISYMRSTIIRFEIKRKTTPILYANMRNLPIIKT